MSHLVTTQCQALGVYVVPTVLRSYTLMMVTTQAKAVILLCLYCYDETLTKSNPKSRTVKVGTRTAVQRQAHKVRPRGGLLIGLLTLPCCTTQDHMLSDDTIHNRLDSIWPISNQKIPPDMATGWSDGINTPIDIFSSQMSHRQKLTSTAGISSHQKTKEPICLTVSKFWTWRRWFSGWKFTILASRIQVVRTRVESRHRGKCLDSWQSYSEVLVIDGRIPEQFAYRPTNLECEKQLQTR